MTKLFEEFLYEVLKDSQQDHREAAKNVFGTDDLGSLLAGIQAAKVQDRDAIFGTDDPPEAVPAAPSTPETVAVTQALSVAQRQGGMTIGGRHYSALEMAEIMARPDARRVLAATRQALRSQRGPVRSASPPRK
jgi:hypothetical protein